MFHLTVAIARFFEILLFDIARSIAGLVVVAFIALAGAIAAGVAVRRLWRGPPK